MIQPLPTPGGTHLTTTEAAELLGVSVRQFTRDCRTHGIQASDQRRHKGVRTNVYSMAAVEFLRTARGDAPTDTRTDNDRHRLVPKDTDRQPRTDGQADGQTDGDGQTALTVARPLDLAALLGPFVGHLDTQAATIREQAARLEAAAAQIAKLRGELRHARARARKRGETP